MNGIKMRQIIFRFLLICNIVLLAVSVFFYAGHRIRLDNYSRQAITLMEKNGVSVETGIYEKLSKSRKAYTLSTSSDERDRFCSSILGDDVQPQAQSGGSIMWTGAGGTVTWNTTGALSGSADLSAYTDISDEQAASKYIEKLMKNAGIDTKNTEFISFSDDSGVVVTAKQSFDKMELEDCKLTFTFDGTTGKTSIDGRWFFGTPKLVIMDEIKKSSPMDILLAVPKTDSGITQITAAEPVYYLSSKSGGRFTLIPCWKLITDKGDIVIDPVTGAKAGADTASQDNVPDNSSAYTNAPSANDGTYTPNNGSVLPDENIPQENTTVTDGSAPESGSNVGDDSSWDSSTGTDKTDPELPDDNGIYG